MIWKSFRNGQAREIVSLQGVAAMIASNLGKVLHKRFRQFCPIMVAMSSGGTRSMKWETR